MRIVNQRQLDRLGGDHSGADGKVAVGGRCDASSLRIEPAVVVDPDPDGPLMQKEIFGPVLPVITTRLPRRRNRFVQLASKAAGRLPVQLKARETRERVLKEMPAGGMLINQMVFQVSMVKTALRRGGPRRIGAYHGKYGFQTFSHRKAVLRKPTWPDLSSLHLPAVHQARLRDGAQNVLSKYRLETVPVPYPVRQPVFSP